MKKTLGTLGLIAAIIAFFLFREAGYRNEIAARDDAAKRQPAPVRLTNSVPSTVPKSYDTVDGVEKALVAKWVSSVTKLRSFLQANPELSIPEIGLLSDEVWLKIVENAQLDDDTDCRYYLSKVRFEARSAFGPRLKEMLLEYAQAAQGRFPGDLSELGPFCKNPAEAQALARYKIMAGGTLSENLDKNKPLISETSPVDTMFDSRLRIRTDFTVQVQTVGDAQRLVNQAVNNYIKAHTNGPYPKDLSAYWPYLPEPVDPALLSKIERWRKGP